MQHTMFPLPFKFLLLGVFLLIVFSCSKETKEDHSTNISKIKDKVSAWLKQRTVSPSQKTGDQITKRIQALQNSLDFEMVKYEKRNEQETFAIIPVKDTYKSENNKDKNPVNYLVVALNQQQTIMGGNIIQYTSDNERKPLPNNTFSKIFNYQNLECSGLFTVLSVADDFQYELKFENGKLKSIAQKISKPGSRKGKTTGDNCIDWYLQTWYVWGDGSMTLIDEVYVGTTCESDCWLQKVVNGKNLRVECSGGGGGGILYDACNMTQAQAESLLNNISGENTDVVTTTDGAEYLDENGIIKKPHGKDWQFYTLHMALLAHPEYTVKYAGVVWKANHSDRWKWDTFTQSEIVQTGGNLMECSTVTASGTSSIAKGDYPVVVSLSATFTIAITCLVGTTSTRIFKPVSVIRSKTFSSED